MEYIKNGIKKGENLRLEVYNNVSFENVGNETSQL